MLADHETDLSTSVWLGVIVSLASVTARPKCLDGVENDQEGKESPENTR